MRVLYVSGGCDELVSRNGVRLADSLQKPFAATALACKVREMLDQT